MKQTLRRLYMVTALVLVVGSLVMLSLLQPIAGTRTDFSIYNTRWNGASSLATSLYSGGALVPAVSVSLGGDAVEVVHHSFADYALSGPGSSLVLLGPQLEPSPREVEWLRAFVNDGGRVLLADDFGAGNAFAEALGLESRFGEGVVLDLSFAKKPQFVVANRFAADPLTRGVDEVVLDYATTLMPAPNATTLSTTGASSWIDRNGNVYRDGNDPTGPFPWLAIERVGEGEVLLMSDPSVLINGMSSVADNGVLRERVLEWLTEGGRSVLIDESHHDYVDPVRMLGAALRDVPPLLRVGLAVGAGALFLALALGRPGAVVEQAGERLRRLVDRLLPPLGQERGDPVARLKKRHPDWDENVLRDILARWEKP